MPLEILHFALVLFGLFHRRECAKIAALAGRGVLLSRIESIFTGFEFADHIFLRMRSERGGFSPEEQRRSGQCDNYRDKLRHAQAFVKEKAAASTIEIKKIKNQSSAEEKYSGNVAIPLTARQPSRVRTIHKPITNFSLLLFPCPYRASLTHAAQSSAKRSSARCDSPPRNV